MTIQLTAPWKAHPEGAVLDLTAADEASLIRAGVAVEHVPAPPAPALPDPALVVDGVVIPAAEATRETLEAIWPEHFPPAPAIDPAAPETKPAEPPATKPAAPPKAKA